MADILKNIEKGDDKPSSAPEISSRPSITPSGVTSNRQEIAGALEGGDKGTEVMTEVERVSERTSEGKEQKGDSAGGKQPKKDDGATAQTTTTATAFTFDEKNLPAVPEMIKKIEDQLRADIRKLERDARRYQGGLLRKPDLSKYSETMIEIRKKNVLLKRLISMAGDMIKKMFLHMFNNRKA